MNRIAILLIRGYQLTLGRFMVGRCRFHPTCSEYARECFERFSFFRACLKSVWRILRCQPFSKGYFDPVVPEEGPPTGPQSDLIPINGTNNNG
ncbi:MAG: membrane protein insertion efficiency factor YidD [Leptospiraceae bacterium]|nr:membrane protein insertion efficiency factor YidD [Leptospiraceae bacterium]MCB1316712.1 membrane protein insertion efficiency factor YidD [Leptospiraceae bacterium]